MCRWMAWLGQPVLIDELLFKTQHGIVDQSLHARMGAEPTNGDGFGLGWYGTGEGPALYHSVSPAWADPNLRELAGHIESPLFLAHVRAAIGSPVQQTNCHPFREGNWLFVHNGYIEHFARHPPRAVAGDRAGALPEHARLDRHRGRLPARAHVRARGGSDRRARAHRRADRGDGRARTARRARSRPASASPTARRCGRCATRRRARRARCSPPPTSTRSSGCTPRTSGSAGSATDDRLIVSEPFADLPGLWQEIPQSSAVTVRHGGVLEQRAFQPRPPGGRPAVRQYAGAGDA